MVEDDSKFDVTLYVACNAWWYRLNYAIYKVYSYYPEKYSRMLSLKLDVDPAPLGPDRNDDISKLIYRYLA